MHAQLQPEILFQTPTGLLLTKVKKHKIGLLFLDDPDSIIIYSLVRVFDTTKTKCTLQPICSAVEIRQLCSTERVVDCLISCEMMKPIPRIAGVDLGKETSVFHCTHVN